MSSLEVRYRVLLRNEDGTSGPRYIIEFWFKNNT